jgi:hypothetical protein
MQLIAFLLELQGSWSSWESLVQTWIERCCMSL